MRSILASTPTDSTVLLNLLNVPLILLNLYTKFCLSLPFSLHLHAVLPHSHILLCSVVRQKLRVCMMAFSQTLNLMCTDELRSLLELPRNLCLNWRPETQRKSVKPVLKKWGMNMDFLCPKRKDRKLLKWANKLCIISVIWEGNDWIWWSQLMKISIEWPPSASLLPEPISYLLWRLHSQTALLRQLRCYGL